MNKPTSSKKLIVADKLIAAANAATNKSVSSSSDATTTSVKVDTSVAAIKRKFHEPPKRRVYRSVNKLGVNDKIAIDDLAEDQKVCFRNLRFHYQLFEKTNNGTDKCEDCDRTERKCSQLHYEQLERKGLTKQDVLNQ